MSSHPLWNHSVAHRLAMLRPGTHRVAYLAPKPDYGTFRYRGFNPTQALRDHSTTVSASYFFYSDLQIIDNLAEWADTLVVVRAPYDERLDAVYRQFHNVGKRVFFDIDDLVFDRRFITLVASSLENELQEGELNQWSAFINNTGFALGLADEVITTNTYLAARISEVVDLPVHVVPNTFNASQHHASEAVRHVKKPETSGLRVGYFSGSHSHSLDFDGVADALRRYLEGSPQSSLTIVGHLDVPETLQSVSSRITRLPFMDFLDMQGVLAKVDLNIVPLQSSPFTFCKSELKYFEAALVHTPTLASRTPVFESAITEGVTGFLADSGTWLERLQKIDALGSDARSTVAASAKAHALDTYSPTQLAHALELLFGEQK
jgi:glycosyltransferase involved in cell wall biosynthesis